MFWAVLILPSLMAAQNLFQNPGFESGTTGWFCNHCTGSLSNDKRSGSHGYKVTGRSHHWSGVAQDVIVGGGHYYYFKIWIKLLNTVNWYDKIIANIDILDKDGEHTYLKVGENKFAFAGRWMLIGGDRYISQNVQRVRFYVELPEVDVEYIGDDAYMDRIDWLSDFVSDANNRIENLRKANLSIRLTCDAGLSGLEVEVQQIRSEFAWGSAVDATFLVDNDKRLYQDFFYDLFEWAVLENSIKWPAIEPQLVLPFIPGILLTMCANEQGQIIRAKEIVPHCFQGKNYHILFARKQSRNLLKKQIPSFCF